MNLELLQNAGEHDNASETIYAADALQFLSPVQVFATPRSVAHLAPLSMGFPRQDY